MGVDMRLIESEFTILEENKDDALEEIYDLMGKEDGLVRDGFAWMSRANPDDWVYLEDALKDWRFPAEHDDDRNIVDVNFTGEKMGDERYLFNAIAEYVEDGSYLKFRTPGYGGGHGFIFNEDTVEKKELELDWAD